MDIHEYQAKELLAKYGVPVQPGGIAYTAAEAEAVASSFAAGEWGGCHSSACVVDRDGVAVRVSERERPAEGAIDRLGQDRHVVLGELVVKDLGVVGPQP